jgi:hypothetical protein
MKSNNRTPTEELKLETSEWLSQRKGTGSIEGREISLLI